MWLSTSIPIYEIQSEVTVMYAKMRKKPHRATLCARQRDQVRRSTFSNGSPSEIGNEQGQTDQAV